METPRSSTHRGGVTGQPPQAASLRPDPSCAVPHAHEPGPAQNPAATRERTLPHGSNEPPGAAYDIERVAKNAVSSAVALGSCFGTMSALNNAVRATPGMPTALKVLTGLLPSAGVFPTPWLDDRMRAALGTTATYPLKPSLAHDAVAGATLFLFNAACARSRFIPKPPANSWAGAAATMLQVTAASLLAGSATELSSQWMNHRDRQADTPPEPPPHIDNPHKATGRVKSQAAAAALQTGLALTGKTLPPGLSLLPMTLVTGGWCFRRVLIPPETSTPGGSQPPETESPHHHADAAPALPFPVYEIPVA